MGFFGYYVRFRKRNVKRSKLCPRPVAPPVCSINDLSDELLIKILSFLPTKVAVSTSILSKQWRFLWTWLPKLEYSSSRYYSERSAIREFIDKNLPLHRAPVIERFSLDLFDRHIQTQDIKRWLEVAVSRSTRDLDIYYYSDDVNIFPSSFYASSILLYAQSPKRGRLYLAYSGSFVFDQLKHLKQCVCKEDSSHLLAQLLKDSPNLRVLDISHMEGHGSDMQNEMVCWNQPSPVPECLLSSLQILNWSRYFGRPQDRDIAVYILKHARRLEKAKFIADTREHEVQNLEMITELAFSSRASSSCELVFVKGPLIWKDKDDLYVVTT